MDKILDFITSNKYIKGLIGLVIIYILEIIIHKAICIYDSYLDENFPK